MAKHFKEPFRLFPLLKLLVAPDAGFIWVAAVYSVAISILTLAVPLSVQVLIEAVANTTLLRAVVVLALVLLTVLGLSGFLVALQVWAMEVFERRLFVRLTSDIALRLVYADHESLQAINRDDLMNRFFEIMNVQKTLPVLAVGGFTLLLQTLVGYIVVSFYHPVFFAFSLGHALLFFLVWRIVDRQATDSSIDISSAKLAMADWLEAISRNNHFFKGRRTIDYALARTRAHANSYIREHRRHFHYSFAQTIGLLALYAAASAALLGIGGWLVIIGELSLGQLVAAELILGAIFAGLAQFYYYLENYYDLCAGLHKLSHFYALPLEQVSQSRVEDDVAASVNLVHVRYRYRERTYSLHAEFPADTRTLVATPNNGTVAVLRDLLVRFRDPRQGRIEIGPQDIRDIHVHDVRDKIYFLGDASFIEGTIADNMAAVDPDVNRVDMRKALEALGLEQMLDELGDGGLDERIAANGYPLLPTEAMRVKLAQVLLMRPRVLVLTPLFDALQCEDRRRFVDCVRDAGITLIHLSNRRDLDAYDRYQLLDADVEDDSAHVFDKLEQLVAFEIEHGMADVLGPAVAGASPEGGPPLEPALKRPSVRQQEGGQHG